MLKTLALTAILFMSIWQTGSAQSRSAIDVVLNISPSPGKSQLHWAITNRSAFAVYVYSYYLYGPAYSLTRGTATSTLDTSPRTLEDSCPYIFPPVLLLRVPANDYREGDFRDPQLGNFHGKKIALSIGLGINPYTVVSRAAQLRKAKSCDKSPYNAIVEWSKIVESNPVQVP
jgi:hypothetical protein